MASPTHTEWPKHTREPGVEEGEEREEREAKRVRLSEPPYHHTPPEGEPEVDSDFEPEHEHEHEHEQDDHPDPGSAPKREKKKRVRTDRDRERDRERRRERDRARRARQAAEREEAKAAEADAAAVEAQQVREDTEEGEYCVCNGANGEEGGTMVGCETCDNWFHPAFCSSRCAFAHARALLSNVEKKDVKALETALSAYPSPAPIVSIDRADDHSRAVLEGAQDAATLALLSSLQRQSADAERALAILARRQAMLAYAVGVWESLVPGVVEEPKKRSKNKKRDGEKDPRPCGFDLRLVWSDAEVAVWDGSEREATPPQEEEVDKEKETALERAARLGLCAVGRRCERHAGWQKTLAVQLEVEATQLTRRRDELAMLGERIERAGTTAVAARRARNEMHAALEAKAKTKT
ncbi:hypothetical protein CcaverHIS002_0104790 [Cutaneotrichosporon cavernicola]|uniref:Uncharacterized protein n=1 Tax=Cutaneotrichosporon cavernicola TaxID=279322 RepID=A0AA48KX08_9TREE|nr:uncharacterized protein CcaverHIS019_0104720 [Cutaneotrichosporon cavernicola]BEI79950.1 hypothetical protein CcaverHIS002_0104790 [Cutaneotrichosporon cavernicola]BEI87754.1 hypothetical protein CcaverHIS019_0104720 [Cutaneotrichosporon cavernicola]BEI95527.1 hypothetical protein CcaverHIS631_0104760 [Cutaneotrichosporon cavernicola]BEJ03303.1 hypothetical protein CcaverHIS641_0104780 [Cutaneotrichosporon cavernicola]